MVTAVAAPREPRLYYGWVVVAALSVIAGVSTAMGGANYGFFITPMQQDLGISQFVFGTANTLRFTMLGVSSMWIGRLLDKYGSRWALMVAGTLTGMLCVSLAFVQAGWHMLLVFGAAGLIGMFGPTMLYTTVPVAKWFVLKRGRAMSLVFVGAPAGIGLSTVATQWLIAEFGWRQTWLILGSVSGVIVVLLAFLFVRRRPEDMGLLPDGLTQEEGASQQAARRARGGSVEEHQWTRAEAWRSPIFWRLAIAFGLVLFGTGTMGLFRIPHFLGRGIDPGIVALGTFGDAAAAAIVGMMIGPAVERYSPRLVALLGFGGMICAFLLTFVARDATLMFVSSAFYGMGMATVMMLQNVLWPNYFGRANVGAIRGAAFPITLALQALGAPLSGFIHDATGTYLVAWWIALGFIIPATVLIVTTRKPTRRAAPV